MESVTASQTEVDRINACPLIRAVKAADLEDTLKSDGPFTVFAPTDEALAKLPAATLADLLKPENKAKLRAILTYHVVAGKVMAKDVVNLTSEVGLYDLQKKRAPTGGGGRSFCLA